MCWLPPWCGRLLPVSTAQDLEPIFVSAMCLLAADTDTATCCRAITSSLLQLAQSFVQAGAQFHKQRFSSTMYTPRTLP